MPSSRLSLRLSIAAAAVACAIAAVPAPASAATNSCRAESMKSGNTILLATNQAVVFTSKRFKTEAVCSYKHRRIVVVGGFVCCQQLRYELARGGRYFGYVRRLDEPFNEVDELGAVDLKTGKRLRFPGGSGPNTVDTGGYVRAFDINSKGTLVWLQENAVDGTPNDQIEVRAVAPGASGQLLDSGTTIDPNSLALSSGGTTAYWVNGGAARSALLP